RLNRGWTPERAVGTPVRKRRGPRPDGTGDGSPTVREWSERTGIPANIIHVRLSRGWTLERAVGTPARKRRGPDLEEIDRRRRDADGPRMGGAHRHSGGDHLQPSEPRMDAGGRRVPARTKGAKGHHRRRRKADH
ncbi:hypothetical protein, partial [Bifidobacterium adolescentis]|uniref:hypothetical protein n=1 Tax=Bifidobacterium adolescentis TaxID=1680 RepID=UPI001C408B9E